MMGGKIANFFGRGRLARNNWLSKIVKALFFFFLSFFGVQLDRGTIQGQSGGQQEGRPKTE